MLAGTLLNLYWPPIPAGKSRRRRVLVRGRLYEVSDDELGALLQAVARPEEVRQVLSAPPLQEHKHRKRAGLAQLPSYALRRVVPQGESALKVRELPLAVLRAAMERWLEDDDVEVLLFA